MNRNLKRVTKVVFFCMLFCLLGIKFPFSNVYAADSTTLPTSLSAQYMGGSVKIGQEIDITLLTVTATYADGTTQTISDYSINTKIVSRPGNNIFTVVYKGKVAQFAVNGKKAVAIFASYSGSTMLSIGNRADEKDVTVMVSYDDGSTEDITEGFTLSQNDITTTGTNKVTVLYQGLTTTFDVYGVEPKTVDSLFVSYLGTEKGIGTKFQPKELLVTAVYTDGTTENINNYVVTPETIEIKGTNKITVSFRGKSASIDIIGKEILPTSITASYKGDTVGIGYSVRKQDVIVTVKYEDNSTEEVTDFSLLNNGTVSLVGQNLITVDYKGLRADFLVDGVEKKETDYEGSVKFEVTNGRHTGTVEVVLPTESDKLLGESIPTVNVKRVLNRAIRNGDYIPFKIRFLDPALDDDLPYTLRITLPSFYQAEGCTLFYTPNSKTTIGAMTSEISGTNTLITTLHHEGTYILAFNPNWDEEETEETKKENKKNSEKKAEK